MIYKNSKFNYYVDTNDELLIVNLKNGISTFRVITGKDIDIVRSYLKVSTYNIDDPNNLEKMLIQEGFLIPIEHDENAEVDLLQTDYIYDNRLHLVIHVTKDCNFRCKYCFIDFQHKKLEVVVQEQIINFIRRNIHKYTGVYISWFGGEPLMAMDVICHMSEEVLSICKKARKTYMAGITTNGYLLTPEVVEKLISLKVYSYCITLDGLEKTHDNQRILVGGNPTFQKIISNLRYIKNNIDFRYLNICIRTNFTKSILENIDELLEFLKEQFCDDNRFTCLFKLANDWGGERIDSIRNELLDPYAQKLIFENVLKSGVPLMLGNLADFDFAGMTCSAIKRNKYTIGTDGIIAKCDTACEETKVGFIDSLGWHLDREKEALWFNSYKRDTAECMQCPFRCMCFQGSCPKRKVLGEKKSACPKPFFVEQLLLLYRKMLNDKGIKTDGSCY